MFSRKFRNKMTFRLLNLVILQLANTIGARKGYLCLKKACLSQTHDIGLGEIKWLRPKDFLPDF